MFTSAPLRFGGNHQTPSYQSLDVTLSGIKITTESLITFNGAALTPTVNTGTVTGSGGSSAVSLADDQYIDIAASDLGNLGDGDFEIEVVYTGTGSDPTPDLAYGVLFIRSSHTSPGTGPSAFLWDSGLIQFRMSGNEQLECTGMFDPTSTTPQTLKFSRVGMQLGVYVDGVSVSSQPPHRCPPNMRLQHSCCNATTVCHNIIMP